MKRVIIEFIGGYWDGLVIDSESSRWIDSSMGIEGKLAMGVFKTTQDGTVGNGFLAFVSPGVMEQLRTGERTFDDLEASTGNHPYVITDRMEEDDGIWLKTTYSVRTHEEA